MKSIVFILSLFMTTHLHAKGELDGTFGISFADEFEFDSGSDVDSDMAFMLGVRYKNQIKKNIGFNVGLGLETIRDLDNAANSELGFFLLEGNAVLDLDQIQSMYVFAGLNYPLIVYEDKNISDVDPVFGVQFGAGYSFTPKAGVELYYRTANFELGSSDANLWGFAVRGFYTFNAF